MSRDVPADENRPDRSTLGVHLVLRSVITLNFLRFALSFIPSFEGTAQEPGLADRIFGNYRIAGFRIDSAWILASSLVIFLFIFILAWIAKRDPKARIDILLCLAWMAAFVTYVYRLLFTGDLDFG